MKIAETAGGTKYHLVADDAPRARHWAGARRTLCGRPATPLNRGGWDPVDTQSYCQTCEAKRAAIIERNA